MAHERDDYVFLHWRNKQVESHAVHNTTKMIVSRWYKPSFSFMRHAHEREDYISTSGLKSDVTIVFLDPDFLYDAGISAIRP